MRRESLRVKSFHEKAGECQAISFILLLDRQPYSRAKSCEPTDLPVELFEWKVMTAYMLSELPFTLCYYMLWVIRLRGVGENQHPRASTTGEALSATYNLPD
jgi:hypothetical protein